MKELSKTKMCAIPIKIIRCKRGCMRDISRDVSINVYTSYISLLLSFHYLSNTVDVKGIKGNDACQFL